MPNDFYNVSGAPSTGSAGSSATMRGEFNSVAAAFDKMPALTGNPSLPVFINSVASALEAVSASTARTRLGLVIGTNVQAFDATLASIANLGTAADRLAYTTGIDTWAEAAITAAGRALIDDADAGAQRTTLGLGTIATQNANAVAITGGSLAGVTVTNPANIDQTLTDGATVNWDMDSGGIATLTLSATGGVTRTMAAPSHLKKGTYVLHLIQNDATARGITWNAIFKWAGGSAPSLSSGSGKRDIFAFICDGTNLYGPAAPMLDVR
jgi:hypothetical protein